MAPWGESPAGPRAELVRRLSRVERWLLPSECLLCLRPIGEGEDDSLICSLCRARWVRLPDPLCARCGQPITLELECRLCAEWPAGFGLARSAVWLLGSARDAVHHLKYGGWWRATEAMAHAMASLETLRGDVVLVPVPLGAARLKERGYNQCDFLARALAVRLGAPARTDLLQRVRDTERQTGLAPEGRRANVAAAFHVGAGLIPPVPVLVDDVFTTGATLVAAAEALLAAGAREVRAVTFARARRPLEDDVSALHSRAG
jgi:ComF family protein